jgi:L-ascorbate metabolism protein UlaG (beta-lactamase superfamily)
MKFTYYGHSCFLIEVQGKKILFDPFISGNPLPEARKIDIHKIEADYIFLSHGHSDHILDCVEIAQRTHAKVVTNFEIHEWLQKQGVENTHPMNTGGSWAFDFGTAKCVVAQHSSNLPDGSYGGNPFGFVFSTKEGNFYYGGDTALTVDMQLIPAWVKLDFAVLPIGSNFTMGIDDAVMAADFVKTNKVIGVHYNTFGFIKIDTNEAIKKFADAGKTLLLPAIGESCKL